MSNTNSTKTITNFFRPWCGILYARNRVYDSIYEIIDDDLTKQLAGLGLNQESLGDLDALYLVSQYLLNKKIEQL